MLRYAMLCYAMTRHDATQHQALPSPAIPTAPPQGDAAARQSACTRPSHHAPLERSRTPKSRQTRSPEPHSKQDPFPSRRLKNEQQSTATGQLNREESQSRAEDPMPGPFQDLALATGHLKDNKAEPKGRSPQPPSGRSCHKSFEASLKLFIKCSHDIYNVSNTELIIIISCVKV